MLMMMNSLPGKADPIPYNLCKMNSTTQTKNKEKSILKKVNKELKSARRVAVVAAGASEDSTAAVSRAEKAVRRRAVLKSTHLSRWAQALSEPFKNEGAICPVNFNPAPSLMTTTARLTHTNLGLTVAAGTTKQLLFFPGHGAPVRPTQYSMQPATLVSGGIGIFSQMDAVAYHYCGDYDALLGSGNAIGPVRIRAGTGVGVLQNCVLGCAADLPLNTASNSVVSVPMNFDSQLPYMAERASRFGGGHMRWQLVSCGVRIFNTTPQLNRGGNITTVQLVNGSGLVDTQGAGVATQAQLDSNPTFKTHGDGSGGVEISWIPRLQDLAYWHSLTENEVSGGNDNCRAADWSSAAFAIFLNNSASQGQTYTIQCVFNVMLSGSNVQAISTPAVVEPSIKAPVEQTVVHLQNTSSTARVAPIVAEAASRGDDGTSMFQRLGNKVYSAALDLAHSVADGAAQGIMRHSYGHQRYGGPLVPRN